MVLEKTLESPLDCKEIQPVHPKGNQFWIFIWRTDTEAETPILWPPDAKKWLIGKDSDARKDWKREEKGTTEDEMVGWHHQLNGHEFEQALGDSKGQGRLVCCSPWGWKSRIRLSDWTTKNTMINNLNDIRKLQFITDTVIQGRWQEAVFWSIQDSSASTIPSEPSSPLDSLQSADRQWKNVREDLFRNHIWK